LDRRPSRPKFFEGIASTKRAHNIDAKTTYIRMLASKMNRMPALKILRLKLRYCNAVGLEIIQGPLQIPEVLVSR
ncbi:MAG: hypothetical protein ACKPJJ_17970, partial [Planctomycetaceae bacterium]